MQRPKRHGSVSAEEVSGAGEAGRVAHMALRFVPEIIRLILGHDVQLRASNVVLYQRIERCFL